MYRSRGSTAMSKRPFHLDTPSSSGSSKRRLIDTKDAPDDDRGSAEGLSPAPELEAEGISLAAEQLQALDVIVKGHNTFLTGGAESGKTVVVKQAIRQLRNLGKRVRIAAPTGKAAQGVGGTTLHTLFGLDPKKLEKSISALEKMVSGNDTLRQRLGSMDVLIIDEISMVENLFFERLNRMMQSAKVLGDLPFGGIQIIVCGDFRQLFFRQTFRPLFYLWQGDLEILGRTPSSLSLQVSQRPRRKIRDRAMGLLLASLGRCKLCQYQLERKSPAK